MENQTTIFDMLYPKKKITKPIRLIEMFSGYGSQALALKYLGVPFEHWKICEWAIKSIQAYKDIHFNEKEIEIVHFNRELNLEFLYKMGISNNYNNPMTKQQIKRLSDKQIKNIVENILITHNLVNIQQVKGKDLEIVDTDKYEYIMTYSFPCQDLSLAGKGKGMSDTSTRSGMLWEVERILTECENKPQILLMENVPQVHSEDNLPDFNKWKDRLEELGYKNYFQDLIATDYGIPQTRNRCFMISLLGDYSYTFPKPIPLKLKLKDMLEDNVDEKYDLSDKQINEIIPFGTYYTWKDLQGNINTQCNRATDENKSALTIGCANSGNVLIKNATSSGNDRGVCVKGIATNESEEWQKPPLEEKSRTLLSNKSNCGVGLIDTNLRIRKLTPRECGRLMGVKDEDIDKIQLSDSAKYHIFGDAIVVNVLMAIFKELL